MASKNVLTSFNAASAIGIFVLFLTPAMAETIAPDQLMLNTMNQVMDVVKKDQDIQSGNQEKLIAQVKDTMLPHFDLDRMSHLVVGKTWVTASASQKESFEREFATFISRIYAAQLPDFKSQTVKFDPPVTHTDSTDVTVTMITTQSGDMPDKVDFSLGLVGDEWKIFDINAEGVSIVGIYRGQFLPLVKQSGMDVLIQKLVEKNQQKLTSVAAAKPK